MFSTPKVKGLFSLTVELAKLTSTVYKKATAVPIELALGETISRVTAGKILRRKLRTAN